MIRHTAANAILIAGFSTDEEDVKMPATNARKSMPFAEAGNSRASIAALIKIACNISNSENLRATACDCLGERISGDADLAAFAARALFAKREAGAPAEYVFEGLLQVIREAPSGDSDLFHHAVDALCAERKAVRNASINRFLRALKPRPMPVPMIAAIDGAPFLMRNSA